MKTNQPTPQQLPIQSLQITHCLGIDPGCQGDKGKRLQGFAAFNRRTGQFDEVCSLPLPLLLKTILIRYPPGSAIVRIDAGWLIEKVWHGEPVKAQGWHINSRLGNAQQIGKRVGRNQGVGISIVEILEFEGYEVTEVEPGQTGYGEWDAELAKRITGWKDVTNDHNRDAMRLSYQR